jgi:L-alanine-DL-glutamate epimerase-like enolase superfamily enzyme
LTERGMSIENGRAVPSDEPGLGIAWNLEAIARLRVDGRTLIIDKNSL